MKARSIIIMALAVSFSGLVLAANNDSFNMPNMMGHMQGMMDQDTMLEQHEKFSTHMRQMQNMSQHDWDSMLALHARVHGDDWEDMQHGNNVLDETVDETVGDE
jgi:hypothetical protein